MHALAETLNAAPAPWNAVFAAFVFFFGACIGSFLNVCIYRIPRDESLVRPRSHCPTCGHMIAGYDNVPLLSYLLLRRRCRHCGTRISFRYFLVELLVAVLFLLVWRQHGPQPRTPVYWLVVSGLVVGTFVDFEHLIIPDRVTLGGMVAGLLLSALVPSLHAGDVAIPFYIALARSALGLAVGVALLLAIAILGKLIFRKDAMGMGDVKLLGAVGAFLGWQAVLFTIVVSSFAGSVVGISLVLARRKKMQSRIPYGPYLALSAILWLLGGAELWHAYWHWLSGGIL
ncbi:MAG: prepilin peptidase [Kiritimatiellae bacterium]|nr:prepilin peptidase [Kiritimatiellia bacterium]